MRLILPVLAVVFGFATADFVIYTFEDSNFTGEAYVRRVLSVKLEYS